MMDRKTKERLPPRVWGLLGTKLREAGLLSRIDGGTIRFGPSLVITEDEVDECIAMMDKVIGEMEKELL